MKSAEAVQLNRPFLWCENCNQRVEPGTKHLPKDELPGACRVISFADPAKVVLYESRRT